MTYLKIVFVILTVLVAGLVIDHEAAAQSGRQSFAQLITKTLTVENAATFNGAATFSDTVTMTGATTLTGAASLGDVQSSGIVGFTPTSYALTGAQTLTPTVSYYELAPAAVLTLTLGTGSAGDYLILANTVTTSTVIVDTGATVGGGNITLGENDIAEFINVDGTWAEISSPDNS